MKTRFKVLVYVELADIAHQIVINQVSNMVLNQKENNGKKSIKM